MRYLWGRTTRKEGAWRKKEILHALRWDYNGSFTKIYIHECPDCGKIFVTKNKSKSSFCMKCISVRHAMRQATRERGTEYGVERKCKWCGKIFITNYGDYRRAYCSSECNEIVSRKRKTKSIGHKWGNKRRAKLERESTPSTYKKNGVPLEYIYFRDKGRCQICGGKVDKSLKVPNRYAATRDHIIPLSLGGKTTPENLQLAHLRCNSRKGIKHTVSGNQPWLISPQRKPESVMNTGA